MKRSRWLIAAGLIVAMAYVIHLSIKEVGYSCEVCMTFDGRTQCRTAAGTSKEEATRTATSAACATLAGGMTDSIRCESTPPRSVT